ncbi:hypothetical protein GCM10020000_53200 [Streptomyces olivoverticillatus]
MAQGGQFGAGADGAEHPAGTVGRGVAVRHVPRQPRAGLGELVYPLGDAVLAEVGEVRAEGVGLDAVDARREVRLVDRPDDVRARDVEDLVAALVPLEVVKGGVLVLEHGAHGAVGDDDAGGERGAQLVRGGGGHGYAPAAWRSLSARSVFSQVKSAPVRPKWP